MSKRFISNSSTIISWLTVRCWIIYQFWKWLLINIKHFFFKKVLKVIVSYTSLPCCDAYKEGIICEKNFLVYFCSMPNISCYKVLCISRTKTMKQKTWWKSTEIAKLLIYLSMRLLDGTCCMLLWILHSVYWNHQFCAQWYARSSWTYSINYYLACACT